MNWDRLLLRLYRALTINPVIFSAFAWYIVHIPVNHCLKKLPDVCEKVEMNLFIVKFPYMNLVNAVDTLTIAIVLLFPIFKLLAFVMIKRMKLKAHSQGSDELHGRTAK